MRKLNSKGQIDVLQPLIMALVVVAVVLVVGFLIFAQVISQIATIESVNSTHHDASYAYNATLEVTNAVQTIPGWLPIIVVVVIGALLIGLVSFLRDQAR